jgi:hypothetical protein
LLVLIVPDNGAFPADAATDATTNDAADAATAPRTETALQRPSKR